MPRHKYLLSSQAVGSRCQDCGSDDILRLYLFLVVDIKGELRDDNYTTEERTLCIECSELIEM